MSVDPLSAPSGFVSSVNHHHASLRRPWGGNGDSPGEMQDDGPPRKRVNLGSAYDASSVVTSPSSPEIQRPGQRRRIQTHSIDSNLTSSDDSLPDVTKLLPGPSKPRILRGRSPSPAPSAAADPASDPKFTRFRLTMPMESPSRVQAAWVLSKCDVKKATELLSDPLWVAPASPMKPEKEFVGRVREIDEATKAQRVAVKEKGKKSLIYANRPILEVKPPSVVTPAKRVLDVPIAHLSPETPIPMPRRKRIKKMVVDSDTEAEYAGSDEDEGPGKRVQNGEEARALEYFNATGAEALQELTGDPQNLGCTPAQADTIIQFRPFQSIEDLNTKLGQGKKKAGPGGISPRMFEECANIFKEYGVVDNILEDCERIGASLRAIISTWTTIPVTEKGKKKQGTSTPSSSDEAALSLVALGPIKNQKAKDYLVTQPALVSKTVQLKDSSTLENWCREFARFAPTIAVQTYYAGKEERVELRQTLVDTQRCKSDTDEGWEVLITTYNLAQGDDRDRKFFRRIDWDSLMNFILPNHFADSIESLRAIFKVKGDSKVTLLAQERVWRAKKMMTPFVLRRRKDQASVLKDLPNKTERIEWCSMTNLQQTIYEDALQRSRKTILDDMASLDDSEVQSKARSKLPKKKSRTNGRTKDKMYLENSSNVLMDLRKAASHPMLFRKLFTDTILSGITKQLLKEPDFKKRGALYELVKEDMSVMTDAELQVFCATYKSTRRYLQDEKCYLDAGKVQVLMKLLTEYKKAGRKVLVFSQFTQILDILQAILKHHSINYLILTGSTPVDVRQTLVDEFTEDESIPVFLLSTKAGGMGINLTAASVVIMFDQDFNPHNDRQAQDRAYRIGQKRDVDVVKLISRGTIEEDMLKLGETKLALDEAVAGDSEDKGESAPEREMKTSLMNVLRQQFERQQGSA
ncbi:hypothetical protein H0H81_002922 [Sphagnurus paluster]|uniref:Helicase C-terminal domain-containing protein n=1 Tax=Sphagnurus paluster TaxID=117069 RepID=A0A9P7K7Y3_9AGAR|nr:hypothetical protein H0H81_002922 [Sphagnurus paluster]